jgi:hypothetical protein
MAVTRGCFGVVKAKAVGATSAANAIGELSAWSFEETAEQIDASSLGTCTKSFVAGAKSTTGNFECHWTTATGDYQTLFVIGDELALEIYPGGTGSGNTYYKTGNAIGSGAIMTSISRGAGVDDIVNSNYGFTVNGELTATAVP